MFKVWKYNNLLLFEWNLPLGRFRSLNANGRFEVMPANPSRYVDISDSRDPRVYFMGRYGKFVMRCDDVDRAINVVRSCCQLPWMKWFDHPKPVTMKSLRTVPELGSTQLWQWDNWLFGSIDLEATDLVASYLEARGIDFSYTNSSQSITMNGLTVTNPIAFQFATAADAYRWAFDWNQKLKQWEDSDEYRTARTG